MNLYEFIRHLEKEMISSVIATCHGVTPWSLMMLLFWEGVERETLALASKCVCCSYEHVLMCDA